MASAKLLKLDEAQFSHPCNGDRRQVSREQYKLSRKQPRKAEAVHAINMTMLIMKLLLLLMMETPTLIGASVEAAVMEYDGPELGMQEGDARPRGRALLISPPGPGRPPPFLLLS